MLIRKIHNATDLASLLFAPEAFPQSPAITDARLLRLFRVKSHFFLKAMACAIFAKL